MTPESISTVVPPAGPAETAAEITTIDFKPRRRRGPMSKIAQLPGHQRVLLNQLLDQDKTYEQVVEEMAKHGVQLNTDNVSKWCTGPYQDYLAALDWQDELHQLRDHAYSFSADGDVRFQEGVVQIGLTQVFRDIKEARFKDDPANSLRLLNSLARLSREALVIRKYADQSAKQQAVELKQLDQDRDLSDNETLLLVNRMDRVFRRRRPSQAASSPAAPSSDEVALAPSKPDADGSPIPGKPDASVVSQSQIKNQNSKIPQDETSSSSSLAALNSGGPSFTACGTSPARNASDPSTAPESNLPLSPLPSVTVPSRRNRRRKTRHLRAPAPRKLTKERQLLATHH